MIYEALMRIYIELHKYHKQGFLLMITWMQRHKKYLIITIWISTIAFVGAGFVGWGQYSYGDKAGSVAKVGEIEISMGELQQSYSNLYNQYNQMFQGNFDEEKAKSFGLQQQALSQLVNQALLLNLARSYDMQVSNKEILDVIKTQEYFFENGVFDKEVYKQVLSRNNLTMQEYEEDVKKQLLIQKTLGLLSVPTQESELDIINTLVSIADKINYKVIDDKEITVDTSDAKLKIFWESRQQNFMTDTSYDIEYIVHKDITKVYTDEELTNFYNENKTSLKDEEGKILPLEDAKDLIIAAMNEDEAKKDALRTYIDYKKGELSEDIEVLSTNISASQNPLGETLLQEISKLSTASPYLKPVLVDGKYITVKLIQTNPSKPKTFEMAKEELLPLYIAEQKRVQLLELAQNSYATFKGKTTEFLTGKDTNKIADLDNKEAGEFLSNLFRKKEKRGFIELSSGKVVLFNILEQKLLENSDMNQNDVIAKLKSGLFQEGLLKNLRQKYNTEIFIEGL